MTTGTTDDRDGIVERAIDLLSELPELLDGVSDPHDVGMRLAERYCGLFDADYCRFWWVTDDPDEVRVLSHFPPIEFQEDWEHIKRLDGDRMTIVKSIFVDGQLRIEDDAPAVADAESRFITVYGALSGVHVPMVVDGAVVGDMAMVSKREKRHFDAAHTDLFHALAAVAAIAIDRAKRTSAPA